MTTSDDVQNIAASILRGKPVAECPECLQPLKAWEDQEEFKGRAYHAKCKPLEFADIGKAKGQIKNLDPTSGSKVVSTKTSSMTEKQRITIEFVSANLHLMGKSITVESILGMWPTRGIQAAQAGAKADHNQVTEYITSDEYAEAMERRGISANPQVLSHEQMAFLELLTSMNGKTFNAKLKAAQINQSIFRRWLKQKAFAEAYAELSKGALEEAIPASRVALANSAANGDLAAIKYLHELTGEYRPGQQQQVDAQKMVQTVLQAIMNNVRDPEILEAIKRDIEFGAQAFKMEAING